MSNQALHRRFEAPEPEQGARERGPKAVLKTNATTGPLLPGKVREVPDAVFGWTMRCCGFAVVALLGLIVLPQELDSRRDPTIIPTMRSPR